MKTIGVIGLSEATLRYAQEFGKFWEIAGAAGFDRELLNQDIPLFSSVQELLDYGQPDGLIVSSYTELEDCTLPLLLSSPNMIPDAARYPAPVMIAHALPYAPIIIHARELIASGRLGQLHSFHFSDGNMDLILHLTGAKPLSISMPSQCGIIKLENGLPGTFNHNTACGQVYEFTGSAAAMRLDLRGEIKVYPFDSRGLTETYEFDYFGNPDCNGGAAMLQHFRDLLNGTVTVPHTTVAQALTAAALTQAAETSFQEDGRYVEL